MGIQHYLDRIGLGIANEPLLEPLKAVHRGHAHHILYENSDVYSGIPVDQDISNIYKKIIEQGRGGWCYEMNGLRDWVPNELGFKVTRKIGGVMRSVFGDTRGCVPLVLATMFRSNRSFRRSLRTLMLCVLLVPSMVRGADDPAVLLKAAFDQFDGRLTENWSYTEALTTSDGIFVGQYDPAVDPQWRLASVDGEPPTSSESKTYLKRKADEAQGGRNGRRDPEDLVTPGTLSLVNETDRHWTFSFVPHGEGDDAAVMEYLKGHLQIAKDGGHLVFIDIRNEDSFRPRFGVRIHEFLSRFEFERNGQGVVLPVAFEFKIRLKAMGLMNVDEGVTGRYTDYARVGR